MISIIGIGYVGLVAAACFADRGFKVTASTQDKDKVALINGGKAPFFEVGLDKILNRAVKLGKLRAVLGREEAILNSDVTFICVGTPSAPDGSIDLGMVYKTAEEVGNVLKKKKGYHLVVIRSTVIPGTSERVKGIISRISGKKAGKDFGICMCPEFLRQGNAVYDTFNPDRIVIGEYDTTSGNTLEKLYKKFYGNKKIPILRMNMASAEMVKYVSNSLLATKISFINEIANICEKLNNVDVYEVAKGVGLDRRIGPLFLEAGAGFGGSCFSKDVNALINFSKVVGYESLILEDVLLVNKLQALHVVELAKKELGDLTDKRIALLGLSFKPNTDDMRDAPSIKIIHALLEENAKVIAYDPVAINNATKILGKKIEYATSVKDCLKNADCCIITTEWEEFEKLKPVDLKEMSKKLIIDGRRVLDPAPFKKAGFVYKGVGFGGSL
jgi:UDPglucose 6-dehydrogenase